SSRRRHTRSKRDWSSDVCSSDLVVSLWLRTITPTGRPNQGLGTGNWWIEPGLLYLEQLSPRWQLFGEARGQLHLTRESDFTGHKIGRASCRERAGAAGCGGTVPQ